MALLSACGLARPDSITRFYQNHGGARVLGQPLTGRWAGSDGAAERVFENAVLYENSAAPEGVSLRPLGLQALGQIEPPAPKLDVPESFYSTRYGHNVAYGMYRFYMAYGGEAVFGAPLTELRIESDQLVQYFENAVILWDTALPSDQAARLMDVGRRALTPTQTPPPPAPTVAASPTSAARPSTQTYVDAVIGFALDYPESWFVLDAAPGLGVILQSFSPDDPGNPPRPLEGFLPGETKCDLHVYTEATTVEAETNSIRSNLELTVLLEEAWQLEGGIPAVRLQLHSGLAGETAWLFTEIQGRVIAFMCYGTLTPFEGIARTLRPTPPPAPTPDPNAMPDPRTFVPPGSVLDQDLPASLDGRRPRQLVIITHRVRQDKSGQPVIPAVPEQCPANDVLLGSPSP
ncbi:MAG: hypothetical protein ACRDH2_14845, partial [Anaerolineales bacterium]